MKTDLNKPLNRLIDKYIAQFNNDARYYPADQAITKLFNAFPENKVLEDILLKVSMVNEMYSTNVLGTLNMAKHIQTLAIDPGLERGDPELVPKIATGHGIKAKKSHKAINFYSFATTYCNCHNRNYYPIYNKFVEKALFTFKRKDQFAQFNQADLRDFKTFKGVISDFAHFYSLTDHDLKQIDKFLWITGKEMLSSNEGRP